MTMPLSECCRLLNPFHRLVVRGVGRGVVSEAHFRRIFDIASISKKRAFERMLKMRYAEG